MGMLNRIQKVRCSLPFHSQLDYVLLTREKDRQESQYSLRMDDQCRISSVSPVPSSSVTVPFVFPACRR
jgi:hypothetical protein